MRVKIADVKRRLSELDNGNEGPITIIFERVVSDKLDGPGRITNLRKFTLYPDGSTTKEVLIDDNNNKGDDNDK